MRMNPITRLPPLRLRSTARLLQSPRPFRRASRRRPALAAPSTATKQRGYDTRSGESAGELGEDRQVGIKRNPIQTANTKRQQRERAEDGATDAPTPH